MKRVLVLGCGPAGLVAAHAAEQAGALVIVAAKPRKSHMYGAQYLHQPIPGIDPGESKSVRYLLAGDAESYKLKVYGPMWQGSVSPEDLATQHEAWDIRHTYDELWVRYGSRVMDTVVYPSTMPHLKELGADLIVSTIPAQDLCFMEHTFRSQKIKAAGEAPELGIKLPYYCDDNTVICNGTDDVSWYRLSNIFGHKTVEWPETVNPPIPSTAVVEKPLSHNCDCFPDVLRVGRYGAWKKGYLVHHVYEDVSAAVRAL